MPQIARRASFVLLLVLSLVVLAPAGASAAAGPAIRSVSAGDQASAGGRLALRVKVRNASSRPSRATKLRAYLSLDRKRDGRDVGLAGTLRVPKLKARAQRTVNVTLTVPSAAKEGRYRVIVCAGTRCVVSSAAVRVARRAASPAPAAPATAPAAPAADSTPAPRPTTTPTPEPTPVVTPEPEPVDPGLPTDFSDSVSFLYEGANRVQTGVAPGTISRRPRRRPARQRALRKRAPGSPASRSPCSITPSSARTLTRADGGYDLAVNGGGPLTLEFERAGYVSAQREVIAPWKDFASVEDLVMVAYDAKVTRDRPRRRRRPDRHRHAGHRRRRHPPGQRPVPRRHEGRDGAAQRRDQAADDARRPRDGVHRRAAGSRGDAGHAAAELRLHVRRRAVRRPGRGRRRHRGPLRQSGHQLRRQLPGLPGRRHRAHRLLRPHRRRSGRRRPTAA